MTCSMCVCMCKCVYIRVCIAECFVAVVSVIPVLNNNSCLFCVKQTENNKKKTIKKNKTKITCIPYFV